MRPFKFIAISVFIAVIAGLHADDSLAQSGSDLCPEDFELGQETATFVDCIDRDSGEDEREDAELERIEAEAICNATPNASVISSTISFDGRGEFVAEVICRIQIPSPAGTAFCPDDSGELLRAFSTLFCAYFGEAQSAIQGAQNMLAEQVSNCTAAQGSVLISDVEMEVVGNDDIPVFFAKTWCALDTATVDIIECPPPYSQNSASSDSIECRYDDEGFESQAEAQAMATAIGDICLTRTDNLGSVTEVVVRETANDLFAANVNCEINIPSFGPFTDADIVRACDESCTLDINQERSCLNGGVIGGPGCFAEGAQLVTRRCNTGTNADGLCPLVLTPTTVVPLLLLDDD